MPHDDAFLRAILEAPNDDAPRLIYADWLEEHGDPDRAEFIRVQIALAHLPEDDPRREALKSREYGLLLSHRDEWLGEMGPWAAPQPFERGFATWMQLRDDAHVEAFVSRAAAWFRLAPLCRLSVQTDRALAPITWRALAALPELGRLTFLAANCLERTTAEVLADTELPRLAELDLNGSQIGPEGAAALLTAPWVDRVKSLELSGRRLEEPLTERGEPMLRVTFANIRDEGVAILAESPRLSRLLRLNLRWNRVADPGVAALIGSPHLLGLERLELREGRQSWGHAAEPPRIDERTSLTDAALRRLRAHFGDRLRAAN
jgi:uncharacterized protein (TIGR02996 family)